MIYDSSSNKKTMGHETAEECMHLTVPWSHQQRQTAAINILHYRYVCCVLHFGEISIDHFIVKGIYHFRIIPFGNMAMRVYAYAYVYWMQRNAREREKKAPENERFMIYNFFYIYVVSDDSRTNILMLYIYCCISCIYILSVHIENAHRTYRAHVCALVQMSNGQR